MALVAGRPRGALPLRAPFACTTRVVYSPGSAARRDVRGPHRMPRPAGLGGARVAGAGPPSRGVAVRTEAASADVGKGEIVAPSVFNTTWFRAGALILVVLAAARSTAFAPSTVAKFAHVEAFGIWLGSSVWVTFIGGITMFKNMKRQEFGRIQAKLFPKYFALAAAAIVILLNTVQFSTRPWLLYTALAATLGNWLVIEPQATTILMERYDLENSGAGDEATKDRIKTLYKTFSKMHGMSSLCNLVALCGAVGHAWFLANGLNLAVLAV